MISGCVSEVVLITVVAGFFALIYGLFRNLGILAGLCFSLVGIAFSGFDFYLAVSI